MKTGIHPEYQAARIVCACGNIIETRSTVPEIHVEICSSCHPFFTGRQKLVDTAGRVEKFRAKYGKRRRGKRRGVATSRGASREARKGSREPRGTLLFSFLDPRVESDPWT